MCFQDGANAAVIHVTFVNDVWIRESFEGLMAFLCMILYLTAGKIVNNNKLLIGLKGCPDSEEVFV